VAEVGDGLLVQVGVVGVEGVAEGGVHGRACGDAIDAAVTGMRAKIAGAAQRRLHRLICQRLCSDEQLPDQSEYSGSGRQLRPQRVLYAVGIGRHEGNGEDRHKR
jgi:hypothetical protein